MFERLCSLLLRFYPADFRRAYEAEARQLIKDRIRQERGAFRRARLLIDLVIDLCATPLTWQPAAPVLARIDGTPRFDFIEPHRIRPEALAAGTLTSMMMLASFALLFQPRVFPPAPAQIGEGSGEPAGLESGGSQEQQLVVGGGDAGHTVVGAVAGLLRDRYVDRAVGLKLSDALLANERSGQYSTIKTGVELAGRLTIDIYQSSGALGIPRGAFVADVVYSERPFSAGPPPQSTEATRQSRRIRLLEQNCLFERIETLANRIAYLKLNGFAEPTACEETVSRAMASANGATALIVDLRDNGGGMGETALQMAGYLFDQPVFFYDPRPRSRVPTHTSSPVRGSRLSDKPVFVLTTARTQSAAEYLVYNLKMLKRVTIVGERTAGAQHSGAFHRIDDHFGIGIQETAPPDNPYPVKGWEFIGVDPDVAVPGADAVAVATALAASRATRSR